MKFCERPWTMMYLINANEGEVWPCSWLDSNMNMGNILTQSVEELYQNENVKKLRESIMDGSFRYCDPHKCTFLANGELPDLSKNEIEEIICMNSPQSFQVAYDETCNHACSSCRRDFFKPSTEYYEKVEKINKKMLPYYNRASCLSINGRGEVFGCEHLLSMLEKLNPEKDDFVLNIETNAALFDKEHWKRIAHLGKYQVKVMATVNSFCDSTYRYLNGYANHVDIVLKNLKFIQGLRKQEIINYFEIAMVVQESNFRELPEYVRRCLEEFEVDTVRIRGIMQFSIPDTEFWIKDVFNPAHPFYKEALDILHSPIMKDPRVWFWEGDYEHARKPKKLPIERFEQYYNVLWMMCKLDDKEQLENLFNILRNRNFALYGAGHLTEYVVRKMKNYGISPFCIYDKNIDGKCIDDVPIYKMDQNTKIDVEVIVNSISFYQEEVMELLQMIGYGGKVVTLEELITPCKL